jgi:molybdate-binding protein
VLAGIADLARPSLRVAGRQPHAGSHVLLTHLLSEAGLRLDQIGFLPSPALSEDEVAASVAEGRADVGFGIRAEAAARGLTFLPLFRERFDLVMDRRHYFSDAVQKLLAFARTEVFATRAARLGGYDLAALGTVAFNA